MAKRVHTDYTVVETTDKNQNPRWHVLVAREIVVSIYRTLEEATDVANRLNIDPYALDRGFTRADRIASYDNYQQSTILKSGK
mgnify:CR=1 FL=1|jgi:hypothetical protein|tara:strand:+ start:213 stop:461 length:249 start_codon:yes stop_codon:yes gene_type:complete